MPRPDDYALYHRILGGLSITDHQTLALLNYFQKPGTLSEALSEHPDLNSEQLDAFVEFFDNRQLLVPADHDENSIMENRRRGRLNDLSTGRQIRIVQLVLSNRCNFRCKYCFEGLGQTPLSETIYANSTPERLAAQASRSNAFMGKEEAERYLIEVIQMAKAAGNTALAVQFFGGEPLICWKTIRHILDHFGRGEAHGIDISYSIITNGSLITDEVAQKFRQFDVPVVVSYDSPKSDARPLPGGKNSHEVIKRGLDLLHKYGNRVVLNSVLGETTFDIFQCDLVDFAFEHGVYEIGVVLDLDPTFYERRTADAITNKLWDVCKYGWSKGVVVTGYWHQIFQGIADSDRYGRTGFQNCSAMGVQFSIEPTGDVFSCKASGGYFGNVLNLEDLFSSESYKKYAMRACTSPEPCRNCMIEHFCGGLCLGPVENKYKHDIYAIEEAACNVYREITRRFIMDVDEGEVPAFYLNDAPGERTTKTDDDISWETSIGSLIGSSGFSR
jgi:uncharacterized protein